MWDCPGAALQRRTLPGDGLRYCRRQGRQTHSGGSYIVRILPPPFRRRKRLASAPPPTTPRSPPWTQSSSACPPPRRTPRARPELRHRHRRFHRAPHSSRPVDRAREHHLSRHYRRDRRSHARDRKSARLKVARTLGQAGIHVAFSPSAKTQATTPSPATTFPRSSVAAVRPRPSCPRPLRNHLPPRRPGQQPSVAEMSKLLEISTAASISRWSTSSNSCA